ncbi:MAG TPA: M23 family metallopeptidase [Thermoleophilaceae bacterium]
MADVLSQLAVAMTPADALARAKWAAGQLGLKLHDETADGFRGGSEWWGAHQITVRVTASGSGTLVALNASTVKIGYTGRLKQVTQRFVDLMTASSESLSMPVEAAQPLGDRDLLVEKMLSRMEARAEKEERVEQLPAQAVLGFYPLKDHGPLIGAPGQGTHSRTAPPDNWQSDNAVDIKVPKGTPVVAVENGVIGDRIGPLNSRDPRMGGLRVYVESRDGNEFYYAHLSKLAVKAGQRVEKGQVIGYSGSAAGVDHLHFAQRKGDPRTTLKSD